MSSVAHKQLTANDDPGGNGHDAPDAAPTIINPDATATLSETAEIATLPEIATDDNDHDMPAAAISPAPQRPPMPPRATPDGQAKARADATRLTDQAEMRVRYLPELVYILEGLLPPGRDRGLLATALVLSQLVYWHGKGEYAPWTYKRDRDMQHETVITPNELRHAKKNLLETRLVDIQYHYLPRVTWYRVNMKRLTDLLTYDQRRRRH